MVRPVQVLGLLAATLVLAIALRPSAASAQVPPSALGTLPPTGISARLDVAEISTKGGIAGTPKPDENPVAAGAVEARWYQSAGKLVVYYAGLTLPNSPSVCLTTLVLTNTRLPDNAVTIAATTNDGCGSIPLERLSLNSALSCGGKIFSLTTVPATATGDFSAWVERFISTPSGAVAEAIVRTAYVTADGSKAPALDMSGCTSVLLAPQAPNTGTMVAHRDNSLWLAAAIAALCTGVVLVGATRCSAK